MSNIIDIADKIYGVKKINNCYITNHRYNQIKFQKNNELEKWYDEIARCNEKCRDIQNKKSFYKRLEEKQMLKNIDKKFLTDIEEFMSKYIDKLKSFPDIEIINIGRNIIYNFVVRRFKFLIDSDTIIIPRCKNEYDVNRWFTDNCNILGLEIDKHGRHRAKGTDHICTFGKDLNSIIDDKQLININLDNMKQIYYTFLGLVNAKNLLIGLEYISSNFLLHRHSIKYVNMVVCYKKDRELSIPILELSYNNQNTDNIRGV